MEQIDQGEKEVNSLVNPVRLFSQERERERKECDSFRVITSPSLLPVHFAKSQIDQFVFTDGFLLHPFDGLPVDHRHLLIDGNDRCSIE